jgi:hypothetical protein
VERDPIWGIGWRGTRFGALDGEGLTKTGERWQGTRWQRGGRWRYGQVVTGDEGLVEEGWGDLVMLLRVVAGSEVNGRRQLMAMAHRGRGQWVGLKTGGSRSG